MYLLYFLYIDNDYCFLCDFIISLFTSFVNSNFRNYSCFIIQIHPYLVRNVEAASQDSLILTAVLQQKNPRKPYWFPGIKSPYNSILQSNYSASAILTNLAYLASASAFAFANNSFALSGFLRASKL